MQILNGSTGGPDLAKLRGYAPASCSALNIVGFGTEGSVLEVQRYLSSWGTVPDLERYAFSDASRSTFERRSNYLRVLSPVKCSRSMAQVHVNVQDECPNERHVQAEQQFGLSTKPYINPASTFAACLGPIHSSDHNIEACVKSRSHDNDRRTAHHGCFRNAAPHDPYACSGGESQGTLGRRNSSSPEGFPLFAAQQQPPARLLRLDSSSGCSTSFAETRASTFEQRIRRGAKKPFGGELPTALAAAVVSMLVFFTFCTISDRVHGAHNAGRRLAANSGDMCSPLEGSTDGVDRGNAQQPRLVANAAFESVHDSLVDTSKYFAGATPNDVHTELNILLEQQQQLLATRLKVQQRQKERRRLFCLVRQQRQQLLRLVREQQEELSRRRKQVEGLGNAPAKKRAGQAEWPSLQELAEAQELLGVKLPDGVDVDAAKWVQRQCDLTTAGASSHPFFVVTTRVFRNKRVEAMLAKVNFDWVGPGGPEEIKDVRISAHLVPLTILLHNDLISFRHSSLAIQKARDLLRATEAYVQSKMLVPGRQRARDVIWLLGLLFLVADAIHCFESVFRIYERLQPWWERFFAESRQLTDRVYRLHHRGKINSESKALLHALYTQLLVYQRRQRSHPRTVVAIKRALLSSPTRDRAFKTGAWEVVTDLEKEYLSTQRQRMNISGSPVGDSGSDSADCSEGRIDVSSSPCYSSRKGAALPSGSSSLDSSRVPLAASASAVTVSACRQGAVADDTAADANKCEEEAPDVKTQSVLHLQSDAWRLLPSEAITDFTIFAMTSCSQKGELAAAAAAAATERAQGEEDNDQQKRCNLEAESMRVAAALAEEEAEATLLLRIVMPQLVHRRAARWIRTKCDLSDSAAMLHPYFALPQRLCGNASVTQKIQSMLIEWERLSGLFRNSSNMASPLHALVSTLTVPAVSVPTAHAAVLAATHLMASAVLIVETGKQSTPWVKARTKYAVSFLGQLLLAADALYGFAETFDAWDKLGPYWQRLFDEALPVANNVYQRIPNSRVADEGKWLLTALHSQLQVYAVRSRPHPVTLVAIKRALMCDSDHYGIFKGRLWRAMAALDSEFALKGRDGGHNSNGDQHLTSCSGVRPVTSAESHSEAAAEAEPESHGSEHLSGGAGAADLANISPLQWLAMLQQGTGDSSPGSDETLLFGEVTNLRSAYCDNFDSVGGNAANGMCSSRADNEDNLDG